MALTLPQEHLEYIRAHDIFEGFTPNEAELGYIELWAPEAIPANNRDIEAESLTPGFLAFVGNGSGEVLAFNSIVSVYMLPMIGMTSDCAVQVANNFLSLAERFIR